MFTKLLQLVTVLIGICAVLSPARAQGTLYVSATGTDTTTCVATAPCPHISAALAVAPVNATIICLTPLGPANSITITKSVDIDCSAHHFTLRDGTSNFSSINISIPVAAADTIRTVRIRGMEVMCAAGNSHFVPRGINITAAAAVYLQDVVVQDCGGPGILDTRTGGQTKLFIKDSIIRNNVGAGIVAVSAAVGITVLDNVTSENNTYGIAVGAGNNVAIKNSVFSGNSTAGIEGDQGSQIVVTSSMITHNNIGIESASAVHISNSDIDFNNTAFSGITGTYGNNRLSGNVSIGTTPSALGGASSDLGQQ